MVSKLTLLLFFLPGIMMAQIENNNGTITIGFGKKKPLKQDTVQQQPAVNHKEIISPTKKKPEKTERKSSLAPNSDFKKDGIFKGLFHVGVNACQVDGDDAWGYKYFGFEGGVGVMARFHKYLSTSVEINYSMKGSNPTYLTQGANANFYNLQLDYVEVPVSLNVHIINPLMLSVGLAPAVMVRYKETNRDGLNITNSTPLGQPNRFDLPIFAALHVIIKQHYAIGGMFSYSLIKLRPAYAGTRLNGQYNNYITLNFMYILDKGSFKKKR